MSTIDSSRGRPADGLWAITSYFNPMDYRSKRANYRVFREHLNVPLVAVELAYRPDFELREGDAEILVQLHGRDILWQKERLLNLALDALPTECRKVVWLDCDVVFENDEWVERTSKLLDRFVLVQPFSHLHGMPPGWRPGHAWPAETDMRRSIPFVIESGMSAATALGNPNSQIRGAPGYAWAAPLEILREHLFYDACIIGGGPLAMLRAGYGCFEDTVRLQSMNALQREHYLAWAKPFNEAVRARVSASECKLLHLWHGKSEHRRYHERNEEFRLFDFDPFIDIAIDENGSWRWNSDKQELHDFVRSYFASRREDG
jgi:hypothetical protein